MNYTIQRSMKILSNNHLNIMKLATIPNMENKECIKMLKLKIIKIEIIKKKKLKLFSIKNEFIL